MPVLNTHVLSSIFRSKTIKTDSNIYKYFKQKRARNQYEVEEYDDIHDIINGFYEYFYQNGYNYDIAGYSLIFFYPPDLSGIGLNPETTWETYFKDFMTLAVDINFNDFALSSIEIPIGVNNYRLPNFLTQSSEFSVVFVDSDDMRLYTYHLLWMRYIRDVISGEVNPTEDYINTNTIDYVGSLYVIKFDSNFKDIRLINKFYGIYPTSISHKEVYGTRSDPKITLINASYVSSMYVEEPYSDGGGLYSEFYSKIGSAYQSS